MGFDVNPHRPPTYLAVKHTLINEFGRQPVEDCKHDITPLLYSGVVESLNLETNPEPIARRVSLEAPGWGAR